MSLFCYQVVKCFFESGFLDTRVYSLNDLAAGHMIEGPAIIIDQHRYGNVCSISCNDCIQVLLELFIYKAEQIT